MDKWLAEVLVCPRDFTRLQRSHGDLVCSAGHRYPIVDDIPIMLLEEVIPTHESHTRATYEKVSASRKSPQSVQILERMRDKPASEKGEIHPHVNKIVAQTCGQLYKPLVGELTRYPIPEIRLPQGSGEMLLDIGCGWGRWSIAASKRGYSPVGIDPSLDSIIAAREVSCQLDISARYIVADARHLPFARNSFDMVFSYNVLQHFSKENVRRALCDVARVLKKSGMSLLQMLNKYGLKCLYNQARGRFRKARDFDVRYWSRTELRDIFTEAIGPTSLSVDGYFGLGIQESDIDLLPQRYQLGVRASGVLRRMSENAQWMRYVADSMYVKSFRE